MPKRCNVLLETVKELPPLQVLKIKGDGLCHDRTVSRRLWSGLSFDLAICCSMPTWVQRSAFSLSGEYGTSMGGNDSTQAQALAFRMDLLERRLR
jgi:hypothetical protein